MRAHSATSTDAGNYLSGVLLSLSMMLNLELPHVNVLSKCDMLPQYGSMERAPKEEGKEGGGMGGMGGLGGWGGVLDLDACVEGDVDAVMAAWEEENPAARRLAPLTEKLLEVVRDYNLVAFEQLCIEDGRSVERVVSVLDTALGIARH